MNIEQKLPAEYLGRPYYALDSYLKGRFGRKVYKISLDGGMSCPNRDGTLGTGGCTFCSAGGSGDFAQKRAETEDIWEQIGKAKKQVEKKCAGPYIAYFQSYTNTYERVEYLEELFTKAVSHPDVAGLSVGTRPDCLEQEKVELLAGLNRMKPVWVELGLQTMHEHTARNIRRGYELPCFEDAYRRLSAAGLMVVVHLILGLPGESREEMMQTLRYAAGLTPRVHGIKLSMLHVLKGTDLGRQYERELFSMSYKKQPSSEPSASRDGSCADIQPSGFGTLFEMDEYVDFVITCIEHLPPDIVVHRITGDGPKNLLIAPLWSGNKRAVMNAFARRFRERGSWQGKAWYGQKKN